MSSHIMLATVTAKRRAKREPLDEWNSLTPSQAARFLGVTRQTVYSRVLRGELPAERVGAHMRVPRSALEEVLRRSRKPPA